MSTSQLIAKGFGGFGDIKLLPTRGYGQSPEQSGDTFIGGVTRIRRLSVFQGVAIVNGVTDYNVT